ncbi:MAG: AMIN domain-containing protein, partial [Geminicoccaceae bacterium]|nr:AMIN domain-containing protein [Geminicoccaceae bacterium]
MGARRTELGGRTGLGGWTGLGGLRPRRPATTILLCTLLLLSFVAEAAAQVAGVTAIRFGRHEDRTRIVVDVDRDVAFSAHALDAPARLVIDLPEVAWNVAVTPQSRPRGLARALRYGRMEPGRARIVVDLTEPVEIVGRQMLEPRGGVAHWRIVVDIRARNDGRTTNDGRAGNDASAAAAARAHAETVQRRAEEIARERAAREAARRAAVAALPAPPTRPPPPAVAPAPA